MNENLISLELEKVVELRPEVTIKVKGSFMYRDGMWGYGHTDQMIFRYIWVQTGYKYEHAGSYIKSDYADLSPEMIEGLFNEKVREFWADGIEIVGHFEGTRRLLLRNIDVGKIVRKIEDDMLKEWRKKAPETMLKSKKEIKQEENRSSLQTAKEIVEKFDRDKLKTNKEIAEWRRAYNLVNNEGGEGYIPDMTSKEQYDHALATIKKLEGKV